MSLIFIKLMNEDPNEYNIREKFKIAQWEFRKNYFKNVLNIDLSDDYIHYFGKDFELFGSVESVAKSLKLYEKI